MTLQSLGLGGVLMSISVDEPTSFLMELLYNLHKATPEKETQRAHRSMIR